MDDTDTWHEYQTIVIYYRDGLDELGRVCQGTLCCQHDLITLIYTYMYLYTYKCVCLSVCMCVCKWMYCNFTQYRKNYLIFLAALPFSQDMSVIEYLKPIATVIKTNKSSVNKKPYVDDSFFSLDFFLVFLAFILPLLRHSISSVPSMCTWDMGIELTHFWL